MNTDLQFMLLVAVLAINHFIIRSTAWHQRMWIFWSCQLLNVTAGSAMVLWGLKEFREDLHIVNVLVGLLFLYHTVQNYIRLQKHVRNQKSQQNTQSGENNV